MVHCTLVVVAIAGTCVFDITTGNCVGDGESAFDVELASPVESTTTSSASTTLVTTDGPAVVELISCDAGAEKVVIVNTGGEAILLSGWLLHDEGSNHSFPLSGITLGAGERVTILTGDATLEENSVVWKGANVWNNDGDAAHLLNGGAEFASKRC